jgi:hypothetical protein
VEAEPFLGSLWEGPAWPTEEIVGPLGESEGSDPFSFVPIVEERALLHWRVRYEPHWSFSGLVRSRQAKELRRDLDVHHMGPEVRVQLGREAVIGLGRAFHEKHRGQFVAVTLKGRLLAFDKSLEALYETLCLMQPAEDFHVARIGFDTVGSLFSEST